jgi:hypothetical protein
MPPQYDSRNGSIARAAKQALRAGDANIILPYVPKAAERLARDALDAALAARTTDGDEHFVETVVRLHHAGSGIPVGIPNPPGSLDHGPIWALAERAIEHDDVGGLVDVLTTRLRQEIAQKFGDVMHLRHGSRRTVAEERAYIEAMLAFEDWSDETYARIVSAPRHAHDGESART